MLVARQRDQDAWSLLAGLAGDPGMHDAGVLYWASACAPSPALRRHLRQRLLTGEAPPRLETGLAWCAEAEDRSQQGLDATAAWTAAVHTLPSSHPYLPEAAWRAARSLDKSGHDAEALALLEGPASWATDDDAHARCRFLLAQIAFRLGERAEALHDALTLRGLGSAQQQEHLEALISSWSTLPVASGSGTGM